MRLQEKVDCREIIDLSTAAIDSLTIAIHLPCTVASPTRPRTSRFREKHGERHIFLLIACVCVYECVCALDKGYK